ncbi:MAG: suppressor of tub2 mutation [Bathelium mastoideum]|nr:MAG: suppressor of tub2 mutation [Bathelium mastoideum]
MEKEAAELLAVLRRSSVAVDAKLNAFNNLKSSIKHARVPDAAQAPIFECIKLAIVQQTSSTLASSGFSTLQHILKRLRLQNQTGVIAKQSSKLCPLLLDRLGDSRESHRVAASQGLTELWHYTPEEIEKTVRDGAVSSTNARSKEAGMQWMSSDHGLQFKSFVPYLVANLEEHDGGVREVAKQVVIELFRNAPEHAKNDLRKQLKANNVRKSIADQILAHIGVAPPPPEPDLKASTQSLLPLDHLNPQNGLAESVMSEPVAPPSQEDAALEPMYVHSHRELDEHFRSMMPHFEGKETEHNWMHRDRGILKVRRLTQGNAPTDYHNTFIADIKSLLEGILKVANSLRTTMSTNGCQLVQELARTMGPALDPVVEILLQNFIKMTANTKHIAADNGSATTDVLFSYVTYSKRLLEHIWYACQDKNTNTRTCASTWLKTLLKRQQHNKTYFENTGGLELAEKCIKKGLADANPRVREGMRGAYWAFAKTWSDRAETIMSTLDSKSQQLLEKDSNNPNAASFSSSISSSQATRPDLRSSQTASRSNLREMMAAQKKQMASKRAPDRPNSAMSTFSPVKAAPNTHARIPSNTSSKATARPTTAAGTSRREAAAASSSSVPTTGSLMSGPVRRPRRPEITRPKTADPYARRNGMRPETPNEPSPAESPNKSSKKSKVPSPANKRPLSGGSPKASPRPSPSKSRSKMDLVVDASSPADHDDLTMVMPAREVQTKSQHELSTRNPSGANKAISTDRWNGSYGDEDGFTMVIPNMKVSPSQSRSPMASPERARRSPERAMANPTISNSPFNSPERSRRPSADISNPPSRRGSPVRHVDEVKVFEDNPTLKSEAKASRSVQPSLAKVPLEELPINEKGYGRSPTPEIGSTLNSPHPVEKNGNGFAVQPTQDRAETLRARRLLASGIERIKAHTLDAHGFRRLQELVKSPNADIWFPFTTPTESDVTPSRTNDVATTSPTKASSNKLAELLHALTSYIELPLSSVSSHPAKAANLKSQALAMMTALLLQPHASHPASGLGQALTSRKIAQATCPRALCAILRARRECDDVSHLSAELERSATELVAICQPVEGIEAVLDVLDAEQSSGTRRDGASEDAVMDGDNGVAPSSEARAHARLLSTGLDLLAQLLHHLRPREAVGDAGDAVVLSAGHRQRLGAVAVKFLDDAEPDVRRADTDFCVELYDVIARRNGREGGDEVKGNGSGAEEFWKVVESADEGSLNLITYYLAKRGKA